MVAASKDKLASSLEWRVLFWMCVLIAINQLGFGALVPSLPLYAQAFGVPASAIGMAVAIYGLARFVVALPAGKFADWMGRRPTIALGGLISGLGNLWCAAATSYPEFLIARFVAGFGAGLIVTTGHVVLADISTPERRGRIIAIYQGTFIFAVGIGPLPGGLLAEYYGLAAPFVATGLASLAAMVIAWFAVPETREFATNRAADAGQVPPFMTQLRLMVSQTGYMLVCWIAFVNAFVRTGALFSIVPLLAVASYGMSTGAVGLAMVLGSFAGLVAAYPAGALSDRFGRKVIIVPSMLATGVTMGLFCFAPTALWFGAAFVLWGIASSVGGAAPAAYAGDSAPRGMNAAALSTYRMTGDAGYVLGPLALGLIVDLFDTTVALAVSMMMCVVIGLAFAIWAPESHKGSAR
ncbi:MAG: MFS transporter [Hyphomicrobiaceae bacterium]